MRVLSGEAGTRVADPVFSGHHTDGVSGRDRGIGPTQGLSMSRCVRGGGVEGKREKGGWTGAPGADRRQVIVCPCGEGQPVCLGTLPSQHHSLARRGYSRWSF